MRIKKNKLFIIGIDGATFDLLDPWFHKGELPNLYRLKKEGSYGNLQTVPNLHSAAAWTSIVTGKNPGKHGIFFFIERDRELHYRFYTGADRKAETIWNILSKIGKKVGIVNVPMTFPAEPVNGIMVSGLDSPSIKDKRSVYPQNLKDKYKILKDEYDIVPSVQILLQKDKPDKAVEKWLDIASYRAEFCKQLLKDCSSDFFMVTFTITDWAHHNLWKYFDSGYPLYEKGKAKKFGHLMLKVYKKMDSIIGELIDFIGSDTNVFIVSDHGAGKHQHGSYYLVDWLIESNFMRLKERKRLENINNELFRKLLYFSKKIAPDKLKKSIKKNFPQLRNKFREEIGLNIFNFIDWSKTKAYTEYKWHNIWINLKGREKYGIVNPGEEYQELCYTLKTELLNWKNETTGRQVVNRVFHKSEIYSGPYIYRAPDLQIWWNDDVVVTYKERKFFSKISTKIEEGWSGDHRLNGIFIAWGPHIKKGVMLNNLSVYDVAPTALYLLDAPIPSGVDGKIIKEAISDKFLRRNFTTNNK
ncbi:MAG: alkaline phosphatase family protein [Candidatus Aminicenantia bacterium]